MPGRVAPLVQAIALEKHYADGPTTVRVLHSLDLEVHAGERIAIVGASGIGKSTLLHLLGTLDRPTSGRLLFDGADVLRWPESEVAALRNREMGFVFQFHHLLGDFTALENVMLPLRIAGENARAARTRATCLLERVGLEARLHHRPGALSGGEQQRVAVARAVVQKPRLLLADEPTGNLDPATGHGVQELLLELNREDGSALVIVTHNDALAAAMGRVLRMADGRLHEEEPPAVVAHGGWGGGTG